MISNFPEVSGVVPKVDRIKALSPTVGGDKKPNPSLDL